MNEQLVADLKAAKALIDTPEKWTKGRLRLRDKYGKVCAMCSIGAIYTAAEELLGPRHDAARDAFRAATGCLPFDSVPEWNDAPERTHAEVMAAFDKAIASAEAQ